MTDNTDPKPSLYQILNIAEPAKDGEILPPEKTEIALANANTDIDLDFNEARQNIKNIIETGKQALDEIASIAHASQDAEAYTTVASMINSLIAANKELLDAHRRRQMVKEKANPVAVGNTNNLNVSITTADLQKMLKTITED